MNECNPPCSPTTSPPPPAMSTTPLSITSPPSPDDSSSTLLPLAPHTPRRTSPLLFSFFLLFSSLSLAAALAFAFLFFSSPSSSSSSSSHPVSFARSLLRLPHPVVLLISSDGFRFGYQYKSPNLPNINRLFSNGTSADLGLIPVFPTLTFPNHYAIVTGLYPAYHGIVNNRFVDPVDGAVFTMASHDPRWWLGEPLWATVANHQLPAATFFWPGSEVPKGDWHCPPSFCQQYNESVPFETRVDTILSYFDLPDDQLPWFITLYFEDPDHQGHEVGPDGPQITEAVENIDRMLGRLIRGLESRGVFDDVNLILLGDHGMVGTCDGKIITLEELDPWIKIPSDWIQSTTPLLAIRPSSNVDLKEVVSKMNEGLASGKVSNGQFLKMYLKEDLPERLHYSDSYRIPPIIGLLQESYKVEVNRSNSKECGGAHGYDNRFFSMRSIFVGHGPQFESGRRVPSFENVQIYNLVTSILNISGAPNNGSASFPSSVLLPRN